MKAKYIRKLEETEIGQDSILRKSLDRIGLPKKVKIVFSEIFGSSWKEFCTVREFVRKFVVYNERTNQRELRTDHALVYWDPYTICGSQRRKPLEMKISRALPVIREKLKRLGFLN